MTKQNDWTPIWILMAMLSMAVNMVLVFQLRRVESELRGCQTDWLVTEEKHDLSYRTNYFKHGQVWMWNRFESNYNGVEK